MSEMKGQVLGIILVIILFGTIATVMKAAFDVYKTKIEDSVEESTGTKVTYPTEIQLDSLQSYVG